jgi:hypothetical protein
MSSTPSTAHGTQDPDHPHAHDTSSQKLHTTLAAATDPKFPLPTLTPKSTRVQYIRSFALLFVLLGSGLGGAYIMEATILQEPLYAGIIGLITVLGVFATGAAWIDWWGLVLEYWWLCLPVGGAAGLAFVMMQERATSWKDTQ